jgi:hypothetical protein
MRPRPVSSSPQRERQGLLRTLSAPLGGGRCSVGSVLPDLLNALNSFGELAWSSGIALAVALLLLALGFLAKTTNSDTTGDLTRDELRLLRAFNEQTKGDPRAYLSVEFAAYRSGVGEYDLKLRRLKELGYLRDSNIRAGYLGHRPVWITADGIRRAGRRR